MKRMLALALMLCLLLSGCSYWNNGSYSAVMPHTEPTNRGQRPTISVYSYADLTAALSAMIESSTESSILSLQYGTDETNRRDVELAVREVQNRNPYAAYAVESIGYVFGVSGGRNAVNVRVSYLPNRVRMDKIQQVRTVAEAHRIVRQQMDDCSAGVVLYFDFAEQIDYAQIIEDYALENPISVMEKPDVSVSLYPEGGQPQIVELKFTYQTSRGELRTMQNKVTPVFTSAQQYISGNWSEAEKCLRLYTFLMNRYEYHIQTSITPTYSLLLHGVGDSRAFAVVYAQMCRQAGVECYVVPGTRDGAPWVWNVIQINGNYYYLDLLRCNQSGVFTLYEQDQMENYVWDYSAYPTEK